MAHLLGVNLIYNTMTDIRLKRAYDELDSSDGLRVLIDRLWPRGITKEKLHYDVWEKDLAPSNELRNWLHEDIANRWNEFIASYEAELEKLPELNLFINKIKHYNTITLLYASKDLEHNNAQVLLKVLQKKLNKLKMP